MPLRWMDAVDRVLMRGAVVMLMGMVLVTFISSVGRTLFNTSLPDDILISEILMVAIVFLPLGHVQARGGHLEVTVLTDRMSARAQERFYIAGLVCGLLFVGSMTYFTARLAVESFLSGELAYGSLLNIPEWIARGLIPLGLAWWCLRMGVQLFVPATRPRGASHAESALD
jgi:TRAP-type C4-dicarboxylate transport system permease small subunit